MASPLFLLSPQRRFSDAPVLRHGWDGILIAMRDIKYLMYLNLTFVRAMFIGCRKFCDYLIFVGCRTFCDSLSLILKCRIFCDSWSQLLGNNQTDEQRIYWSCDKQVTSATPPCLIVGCQDDPTVPITNSIRFYEALTAHNVPSSLLIVPYGKHGWGFSRQFPDRDRIDQAILSFIIGHTK